jgi:hypothetical protein
MSNCRESRTAFKTAYNYAMASARTSPSRLSGHRMFALWLTRSAARADGSADSSIGVGSTVPVSRPKRRVIGPGQAPFTLTTRTDFWTAGDPFWLLASQVKLKDACAVSMVCIAGFFSVRLRRLITMEGGPMVRNEHGHRRPKTRGTITRRRESCSWQGFPGENRLKSHWDSPHLPPTLAAPFKRPYRNCPDPTDLSSPHFCSGQSR